MQIGCAGLVTDGSVRDTNALLNYGFPVYSHSTTANQGPAAMQPWAVNEVINVGGVSVRPGDFIIGDQDGVVVVPQKIAPDVLRIAEEREEVEDVIKEALIVNPGSPGRFYPFRKPGASIHARQHMLVNTRSSPFSPLLAAIAYTLSFPLRLGLHTLCFFLCGLAALNLVSSAEPLRYIVWGWSHFISSSTATLLQRDLTSSTPPHTHTQSTPNIPLHPPLVLVCRVGGQSAKAAHLDSC
jgi:hypothetical protein